MKSGPVLSVVRTPPEKGSPRVASTIVTVGSSVGLHARPAALIAEAAVAFDAEIWLELADDQAVDPSEADSSLMVMALGAEHGDRVKVSSTDPAAVEKIAAMIAADLDT